MALDRLRSIGIPITPGVRLKTPAGRMPYSVATAPCHALLPHAPPPAPDLPMTASTPASAPRLRPAPPQALALTQAPIPSHRPGLPKGYPVDA